MANQIVIALMVMLASLLVGGVIVSELNWPVYSLAIFIIVGAVIGWLATRKKKENAVSL